MTSTVRLTVAQALVRFLGRQYIERDGVEQRLFAGLLRHLRPRQRRRASARRCCEARARRRRRGGLPLPPGPQRAGAWCTPPSATPGMRDRLSTLACTASSARARPTWSPAPRWPRSTGSGAAAARRRLRHPGRQPGAAGARGPDARYDVSSTTRFGRCRGSSTGSTGPSSCRSALLGAMRVLTDPAETGAVTLALPQDVQAEACDWPDELFARAGLARRPAGAGAGRAGRAPSQMLRVGAAAADRRRRRRHLLRGHGRAARASPRRPASRSRRPRPARARCPTTTRRRVGAIGATGTTAANALAARGRRRHRRRHPLQRLHHRLARPSSPTRTCGSSTSTSPRSTPPSTSAVVARRRRPRGARALDGRARRLVGADATTPSARPTLAGEWDATVERALRPRARARCRRRPRCSASSTDVSRPRDVVVCAAGSMPGDLHKLWRTRDRKGYHVEYGFSCMGYEIAGGLGVKLADARPRGLRHGRRRLLPDDGRRSSSPPSQEGIKLIVVLVQNHGFASIGALSESLGLAAVRHPLPLPHRRAALDGDVLPVDLAANAASLGAHVHRGPRASTSCAKALAEAAGRRRHDRGPRRDRPARARARQRRLVGRPGRRGLRAGQHPAARTTYEQNKQRQRQPPAPVRPRTPRRTRDEDHRALDRRQEHQRVGRAPLARSGTRPPASSRREVAARRRRPTSTPRCSRRARRSSSGRRRR